MSTFYFDNLNTSLIATGSLSARSLKDRFSDIVNVKDFGALGNGVADDTAAIQAALDVDSGAKMVYLPAGTYKITSALLLNNDNYITGAGRSAVLKSTHNGSVIAGKGVTPASGTNVRRYSGGGENFSIEGPTASLTSSVALDMRGCTMFKWSNILITNIHTGVFQGDGYSSYYNDYYGLDIVDVNTGYKSTTLGNENTVISGGVRSCVVGTTDSDNSHNKYIGLSVEGFTTAHETTSPAAVGINYITSRLESGTTGINLDSSCQDAVIISPYYQSITTPVSDNGANTIRFDNLALKVRRGSSVSCFFKQTINAAIGPIPAGGISQIAFTLTPPSGTSFFSSDSVTVNLPTIWPGTLMAGPLIANGTNTWYLPVYNPTASPVSVNASDYVFFVVKTV